MQYKDLKSKARILGIRLTKTVKGKRVQLSPSELRKKISMNFNDTVRNAQRVIKMCKTIVAVPATVSRSNNVVPLKPQTRPPPPPPRPPAAPPRRRGSRRSRSRGNARRSRSLSSRNKCSRSCRFS